ncbi:unnamed protein product [Orchesella dallaii]|uniref:F-box domain-containing protein n=1 Tax=Orchesella dallaii TaxID=48710 RepID=A0ABP1PXX1_9HEXA
MSNVKKSRSEADLEEVAMDEVCHFDKLPNEILELIFKHVLKLKTKKDDDSNQKSKFAKITNIQSDLNCHLVNSRWKSVMEQVLEKNALFLWKKMSIPVSHWNLEAEPPYLGCLFVKKEETNLFPAKMLFLSPPLESWGEENGNPFPSRSLKITSKLGETRSVNLKKDYQPTLSELVPFFTKFGHHLTSLILKSVTLSPETLIGILNNTPNLKALNLIRVLICMDVSHCPELPALPDLHHVRLVEVKTLAGKKEPQGAHWCERDGEYFLMHENDNNDDKKQLYNWILSPYKEQLLTLDIFAGGIGTASNFAKLERLVISYADELTFLQPNVMLYPCLKSLLLTDVQVTYDEDRMEWLQRNIAPFAKTLSELYVDFPRRIGGEWLIAQPLFQLNPKSAHKNTKNIVFREMKTLVVPFPIYPQEMQVIKDLMKEFPNLETLRFLVRGWEYKLRTPEVYKVLQEDYDQICPKCKNVGIFRFV